VGSSFVALIVIAALAATASGHTAAKTISVAIVANPQMQDIASLTPSLFTKQTGIQVKYTILDEGKLRAITTRDVGSGGKAFDAVMIGMYETPQFGAAGLLQDLTPQAKADKAYNYNDLIPAVRSGLSANGKLYASPFYAESSFVMYRKDVLKSKGVTMPARPTVAAGRDDRTQDQTRPRWPASACAASRVGRSRCRVHDGAEHVRRHVVVVDGGRQACRGAGRPAGSSRRPSTSTPSSCRTRVRRTRPTRASTSASRSTRPARSRCGTTPPSPAASRGERTAR
jgi:hypothetical protein